MLHLLQVTWSPRKRDRRVTGCAWTISTVSPPPSCSAWRPSTPSGWWYFIITAQPDLPAKTECIWSASFFAESVHASVKVQKKFPDPVCLSPDWHVLEAKAARPQRKAATWHHISAWPQQTPKQHHDAPADQGISARLPDLCRQTVARSGQPGKSWHTGGALQYKRGRNPALCSEIVGRPFRGYYGARDSDRRVYRLTRFWIGSSWPWHCRDPGPPQQDWIILTIISPKPRCKWLWWCYVLLVRMIRRMINVKLVVVLLDTGVWWFLHASQSDRYGLGILRRVMDVKGAKRVWSKEGTGLTKSATQPLFPNFHLQFCGLTNEPNYRGYTHQSLHIRVNNCLLLMAPYSTGYFEMELGY